MNEYKEECFKRFENTQKYKKYNTDELIDEIFDLQQELDQYKNNWEELKEDITHLLDIIKRNEENIKIFQDEWLAIRSLENKMKELEEKSND